MITSIQLKHVCQKMTSYLQTTKNLGASTWYPQIPQKNVPLSERGQFQFQFRLAACPLQPRGHLTHHRIDDGTAILTYMKFPHKNPPFMDTANISFPMGSLRDPWDPTVAKNRSHKKATLNLGAKEVVTHS